MRGGGSAHRQAVRRRRGNPFVFRSFGALLLLPHSSSNDGDGGGEKAARRGGGSATGVVLGCVVVACNTNSFGSCA